MKNKEIEELLKGMRDVSNTEGCSMNLDRYLVKLLLSYIEQLENNRDKAIEYVKKHTYHDTPKYNGTRIMTQGCLIATNDFWYEDLLDILKDDSDE